jgi:predicted cupin superfamily sugar epimerase
MQQQNESPTADEIINLLGLLPHPEGGYYVETSRSPPLTEGGRSVCTAIYFLLTEGQKSHWHKVDAVETWLWHAGDPVELKISKDGKTIDSTSILSCQLRDGHRPQVVIPKDAWQSARPLGKWTLVSCIVAPGFEFSGFELAAPDWEPKPE